MIDIGHLLWIVPTAAAMGFIVAACVGAGDNPDSTEPDACKYCMCVHCPYNPSITNYKDSSGE